VQQGDGRAHPLGEDEVSLINEAPPSLVRSEGLDQEKEGRRSRLSAQDRR
jgi:hypothetical protein